MPPPPHHRFWVFDMDGTLTVAAHDFNAIRKALNIDIGIPILEAIANMPAPLARQATAKLHRLEMDIAADSVAQPDAWKLLKDLQAKGCKLGIVTRNAEDIALVTLEAAGLMEFFLTDTVIGRERCTPKPDPAGINHLMTQWRATPSQTVMVGDYVFDLQAGRNAGVTTVHFSPEGCFDWPQATDHRIKTLAELPQLLK